MNSQKQNKTTENYKILLNDWPYGFDSRIVHLVVWTKFPLPPDPTSEKGDISPQTSQMISKFVRETFGVEMKKKKKKSQKEKKEGQRDAEGEEEENVVWFLNWASLKSIHAVEHFHVLLFEPDEEFVERVTRGDVALRDKVKMKKGREEEGEEGEEGKEG